MSERALTVTKQPNGSYRASRDGKQVTVVPGQLLGDEAVDQKRIHFDALVALEAPAQETYAALVDWKVDAYRKLAEPNRKDPRLAAKLAHWENEHERLSAPVREGQGKR